MKASARSPVLQESSEEIKKRVKYLLSAAGVKNQLPTPKEEIVTTAKLVEIGQIELSEYEQGWLRKGTNFFKSALAKVKGLLDFKEKIIYVNPEIHHAQKTFVTYHEVTHRILPWHEILYNPHVDNEYSIDPRVATGLETEANFGASLIQFQIDRFAKELKDLPVGLGTAKYLADRFETSLHSTFRKYIEDNDRPCALLVLEGLIHEVSDFQPGLQLWYPLQSKEFTVAFGMQDWEKFYCPGHPIYDTVFSNSLKLVNEGEIILKDLKGFTKKCKIETFYNTFNYFILIHPIPRLPSRKKIIILDRS
jgi:hypothetical protein